MPLMEISIVPVGTAKPSVSREIARSIKILGKRKGIRYRLTAMGTIVQARSLRRLFEIALLMHKSVLRNRVRRVVTTIKIDDRIDKKLTFEKKLQSLQKQLNGLR